MLSSDGSLENLQSQGVCLISFLSLNLLCLAPVLWFGLSQKNKSRTVVGTISSLNFPPKRHNRKPWSLSFLAYVPSLLEKNLPGNLKDQGLRFVSLIFSVKEDRERYQRIAEKHGVPCFAEARMGRMGRGHRID